MVQHDRFGMCKLNNSNKNTNKARKKKEEENNTHTHTHKSLPAYCQSRNGSRRTGQAEASCWLWAEEDSQAQAQLGGLKLSQRKWSAADSFLWGQLRDSPGEGQRPRGTLPPLLGISVSKDPASEIAEHPAH